MKLFTVLFLLVFAALPNMAQTNSMWTFKKGGKFEGRPVDFKGVGLVTMVGAKDGKRYALSVALLSDDDQARLASDRPRIRLAELRTAAQSEGRVEVTGKLMDNYRERFDQKECWMEADFLRIDNNHINNIAPYESEIDVGFEVYDKDREFYRGCFVSRKEPAADRLIAMKRKTKLFIRGKVAFMATSEPWIVVESVEALEGSK